MSKKGNAIVWQGKFAIGDGWGTFVGVSGDNTLHKHLALQIVIAQSGNGKVQIAGQGVVTSPVVIVAPNVEHKLLPGAVQLIYLEPKSELGIALTRRCKAGFLTIDDMTRDQLLAAVHCELGQALILVVANHFGVEIREFSTAASSDRIECLLADLKHRQELPKTLNQLAIEASLSPSRLRHRIAHITGMPYRPYLRWLRLQRALKLTIAGNSITQAAHAAGFADGAHLARTMRRHFGITLSNVLEALRQR